MRAGKLRRRVTLQKPVLAQDQETEAQVKTWVDVAKVWADVVYLNGIETLKSATDVSIAKASIRIRFRADVDATWRVVDVYRGKTTYFNISAVLDDDGGPEHVDLACQTGANDG